MKRWLVSKPAKMLAGALCAGLVTTWAVGKVLDKREEDRRNQYEVAQMTNKMKTVCVGRFLIDVPQNAQIEMQARLGGYNLSAFDETREEFQQRVAVREAQIRGTPDWRGGDKNLESARDVNTDSGLTGKIFNHGRAVDEGTRGNGLGGLERYRFEGITTEALVHGQGMSIDLYMEGRGDEWLEELPRLVNQIVLSPDNRTPAEPGFCFDRGYVREPINADQREQITLRVGLPNHPDVDLMLVLMAGLKPEEHGILARSDAINTVLSIAGHMRGTRLRGAPREIGGLAGEELVELVVEENEARVHSFWWEVNGTKDNVFVPSLTLTMTTGNGNYEPVPSSLSDGAALGLWDTVASSIRVRKTDTLAAPRVDPPTTSIGTYAAAGEPCPDSGWWLCGDGGNRFGVLGGQRQYIRKGALMPQALLLPPRTLWQKVRGVQPSFTLNKPTFWKLADKRARKRAPPALPLATPASPAVAPRLPAVAPGLPDGADMSQHGDVAHSGLAITGVPCPVSGWWRCEQSDALDGTRWFAQGAIFPPATFAVMSAMFGRTASAPKSVRRRSDWRLVRAANLPAPGLATENSADAPRLTPQVHEA